MSDDSRFGRVSAQDEAGDEVDAHGRVAANDEGDDKEKKDDEVEAHGLRVNQPKVD